MNSPHSLNNGTNGISTNGNQLNHRDCCIVEKIVSPTEAIRIATEELRLDLSYKLGSLTPDMPVIALRLLDSRNIAIAGFKYSKPPMTAIDAERQKHEEMRNVESTHAYGHLM